MLKYRKFNRTDRVDDDISRKSNEAVGVEGEEGANRVGLRSKVKKLVGEIAFKDKYKRLRLCLDLSVSLILIFVFSLLLSGKFDGSEETVSESGNTGTIEKADKEIVEKGMQKLLNSTTGYQFITSNNGYIDTITTVYPTGEVLVETVSKLDSAGEDVEDAVGAEGIEGAKDAGGIEGVEGVDDASDVGDVISVGEINESTLDDSDILYIKSAYLSSDGKYYRANVDVSDNGKQQVYTWIEYPQEIATFMKEEKFKSYFQYMLDSAYDLRYLDTVDMSESLTAVKMYSIFLDGDKFRDILMGEQIRLYTYLHQQAGSVGDTEFKEYSEGIASDIDMSGTFADGRVEVGIKDEKVCYMGMRTGGGGNIINRQCTFTTELERTRDEIPDIGGTMTLYEDAKKSYEDAQKQVLDEFMESQEAEDEEDGENSMGVAE